MAKEKKKPKHHVPEEQKTLFQIIAEYIQALIGAVLLAVLIRGFVFEPFKIPSESMVPTLLVGDHIFVARYQYGLRVPFTKLWLTEFDGPKRGDVVVFSFPEDESVDFIKRVVGVPGDRIAMHGGVLTVNGEPVRERFFEPLKPKASNKCVMELAPSSRSIFPDDLLEFPYYLKYRKFQQALERLPGGPVHMIQHSRENPNNIEFEITVPERSYFVMGDNRDQSHDSRMWGMVPRENLKGKAVYIWLSLDHERNRCPYNFIDPRIFPNIRWDRFGRKII